MKKALAILVAVMLIATVCMTASAASCTLAFGTVEVAEGTATVDVPLNITANDGIWALIVEASYDTSKLEFVSAAAPSDGGFNLLANELTAGTVKLVFDAKEMANVTATGAIATLTFKVKAAAGDEIAIAANLPDAESNINVDGDNVDVTAAAGAVKVVAAAAPSESEAPTQAPTAAPTEAPVAPTEAKDAPATGSVIPAAAIVLAAASAAVLGFARKK